MGPVEKGHSPFPSTERAIYGFSVYLGAHIFLGEEEVLVKYKTTWVYFLLGGCQQGCGVKNLEGIANIHANKQIIHREGGEGEG